MSFTWSAGLSLDPADWSSLRVLGHRMLDDMFDNLMNVSSGPVWQPMPASVRAAWQEHLPWAGTDPAQVYDDFLRLIVPYVVGIHRTGWVHGGGTPVGMLAELLAGALNANCGGRDHAPIAVERQVVRWAAEMLGLPAEFSGLIVSGTSMANFIAVVVARVAALGRGCMQGRGQIGAARRLHFGSRPHVHWPGNRIGRHRVGRNAAHPVRCSPAVCGLPTFMTVSPGTAPRASPRSWSRNRGHGRNRLGG